MLVSTVGNLRKSCKSQEYFCLTFHTHGNAPICLRQPWSVVRKHILCFTSKCVLRKQRYHRSRIFPNHSSLTPDNGFLFIFSHPKYVSKKLITDPNVVNHKNSAHDMSFWVARVDLQCPRPKRRRKLPSLQINAPQPVVSPQDCTSVFLPHLLPIYNFIRD